MMNKKGLVLAEALVAVAVLVTGVTIISSIISNALNANAVSRDYLIAQNLATEAVEIVRSLKQTTMLRNPDDACWIAVDPLGICGPPAGESKYTIEKTDGGYFKLEVLAENPENEEYFQRYIDFTAVGGSSARFDVVVSWRNRSITRTFTISKI